VEVAAQLAHRVDPYLVAQRLEDVEVRVRPAFHPPVAAQQLRREEDGRVPLAHAARPVEEVGVRGALREGGPEETLGLRLLR
jgi:hypothetical protein